MIVYRYCLLSYVAQGGALSGCLGSATQCQETAIQTGLGKLLWHPSSNPTPCRLPLVLHFGGSFKLFSGSGAARGGLGSLWPRCPCSHPCGRQAPPTPRAPSHQSKSQYITRLQATPPPLAIATVNGSSVMADRKGQAALGGASATPGGAGGGTRQSADHQRVSGQTQSGGECRGRVEYTSLHHCCVTESVCGAKIFAFL